MKEKANKKQQWSLYFAVFTAFIVGVLNWKNGFYLEDILVNIVISFVLMYFLTEIAFFLFTKYELWSFFEDDNADDPEAVHLNLVLEDEIPQEINNLEKAKIHEFSKQINPSLIHGIPDNKERIDMKQKMGLT